MSEDHDASKNIITSATDAMVRESIVELITAMIYFIMFHIYDIEIMEQMFEVSKTELSNLRYSSSLVSESNEPPFVTLSQALDLINDFYFHPVSRDEVKEILKKKYNDL
jgi:hypothetical protein